MITYAESMKPTTFINFPLQQKDGTRRFSRLGDVITGQALLSTNQPVSGQGDPPWYQH